MRMYKTKTLVITIVVLCVGNICQAQDKDTLEAKLAKLEAKQSTQKSCEATESRPVCKKKVLDERIDELEAQQKKMQNVDKGIDTRMSALESKLMALETLSKHQPNEALLSRITELERKVQQLQAPFESAATNKPEVEKDSVSKVDSTDGSRVVAKITESEPIITASEMGANVCLAEPVMKYSMYPVKPVAVNFLSTTAIEPEESPISLDIGIDYFGKYIWRGQNLSDDPVFQPGVSMAIGGLTVGWWANVDTTKINGNNGEFTEHDWYVDYSGDLPGVKGVGYSVGAIYYYFPSLDNGTEDTTEIYGGLSFDLPLSPSVTVYHDIEEVDGTYVSFGLSHSIDRIASLGSDTPIGMEMGASLGWGSKSYNQGYWGDTVKSSKLNDLALSVSFPVEIGGWTVAPSLNYVTLLNSKIRKTDAFANGGNKSSDYFFAGISLSKSF